MIATTLRNYPLKFETKAGLFSKDHIDTGSLLLINTMDVQPTDVVIDIGCGYGPIGLTAAKLASQGNVYMVDVDIRAVKYSKINAELNNVKNVTIIPSDGFEELPFDIRFNAVLSNPPSHTPKETVIQFIEDAHSRLVSGGKIYFITEKRISPMIKREFERVFGNYEPVASDKVFVVSMARRL